MRNRSLMCAALLALVAAASTGCATQTTGCFADVAAREGILLQAPASGGRLINSERESIAWRARGELLLTPTALYMDCASGGSHAISYATMTNITVRQVSNWVPFLKDKVFDDLLVIQTSRPTCWQGCVYDLKNPLLAQRVADLIEANRATVDPFGRRDGPRKAWLAAGVRNAMTYWAVEPAYLEQRAPEQREALERWFCERTDCKGSGRTGALYGPALVRQLPADSAAGYTFLELPGVEVNHRTELAVGALVKRLKTVDPGIDSLLVSDLQGIAMAEKISADYQVSVEVTFRAFVDYFDLAPIKDGDYFFESHVVTRPLDEWLSLDQAGFDAEVNAVAQRVAARIRQDLAN